jgi:hypothetical protein
MREIFEDLLSLIRRIFARFFCDGTTSHEFRALSCRPSCCHKLPKRLSRLPLGRGSF